MARFLAQLGGNFAALKKKCRLYERRWRKMVEIIGGILITWLIIKIGEHKGWTGTSPLD